MFVEEVIAIYQWDKYMNIRKSTIGDLDILLSIYKYAREQMKLNGNPTQWGNNKPSIETIINDITNGNSYIIEKDHQICGTFVFIIGNEPTYENIENGKWLNDDKYGVIHRVASNGKAKGIIDICLSYCENIIDNIRIDTHKNNTIMQNLLEKAGYQKCGTIFVEDGTPRIAYQKILKS